MQPLIAGNWKMNGVAASVSEVERLLASLGGRIPSQVDVLLCPPATLLPLMARFRLSGLLLGGQDCHTHTSGAHTGDISAEILKDAGADFVIVGHSERRADHHETGALVRAKALAAQRAGLIPIICVGETGDQRKSGAAKAVVASQLEGSLPQGDGGYCVAYEPVWAIGTGLTPTSADIAEMHALIRRKTGEGVSILYGGSVKPANASEILTLDHVDGALVGGASLKADDFGPIIRAAISR